MEEMNLSSPNTSFVSAEEMQKFAQKVAVGENVKTYNVNTDSRRIELTHIKSDNDDNNEALLFHPAWKTGFFTAENKPIDDMALLEAMALQQAAPDMDIFLINGPGVGKSSRLSKEAKHASKTGSFESYGELYREAFKTIEKDYDKSTVAGFSMGARIAIARAMEGSNSTVAIDPPGSLDLGYLGLLKRFALKEGAKAKEIQKAVKEVDPTSYEAQRNRDGIGFARSLGNAARRGALWDMIYREPNVMGQEGLARDLTKVTQNRDAGKVVLFSPEQSQLTSVEAVDALGTDIEHIQIKSESHSIFSARPRFLTHVVQEGLRSIGD